MLAHGLRRSPDGALTPAPPSPRRATRQGHAAGIGEGRRWLRVGGGENLTAFVALPSLTPMQEPAPLLERYKIAYAEYRAEVSLGNERQKLFVTLNPAVAALSVATREPIALTAALVLAACASVVGIVLVSRSHGRYQQTRHVLLALAKQLSCESDWQTTGGMREERGEPRYESRLKVTTAVKALLAVYALFDVVAVAWLWAR